MRWMGKLLSLVGAVAGVFYVGQKAIARAYENTLHRYVVFEEKRASSSDEQE